MSASTPISTSKSAALSRALDAVSKGYLRYVSGKVCTSKAKQLAQKFHDKYGIGSTPATRANNKLKGQANAILVLYWPIDADYVEWIMFISQGDGFEAEKLHTTEQKPRLQWLGYELVRHSIRNRAAWTWRRTKAEMEEHYTFLATLSNKQQTTALAALLQRIANQPGFHGIREQSKRLFDEAKRRGYDGELPFLFFMQKISHGKPLPLTPQPSSSKNLKTSLIN